jgi:hypothetical protein
MSYVTICPHCQRQAGVQPQAVGQSVICPSCKRKFIGTCLAPQSICTGISHQLSR